MRVGWLLNVEHRVTLSFSLRGGKGWFRDHSYKVFLFPSNCTHTYKKVVRTHTHTHMHRWIELISMENKWLFFNVYTHLLWRVNLWSSRIWTQRTYICACLFSFVVVVVFLLLFFIQQKIKSFRFTLIKRFNEKQ